MDWNKLLNEERPSGEKFAENPNLKITPFERDYFTIVESSYFRRLQRKTQVYTLDENDYVRTRLTHSMEVAATAELLGRRIASKIIERGVEVDHSETFLDRLSMVLRCAGLLHDLGNPPFGHKGEEYIRHFFKDNEEKLRKDLSDQMWNDLINYDGNTHTLRIITRLGTSSNPKSQGYGMDLTNAVINSIVKYPWNSLEVDRRPRDDAGNPKEGKIGYYHSEEWIIKKIVATKTGTFEDNVMLKDPIMLIMEAADDIAYATADIEDAIKTNRIDINDFLEIIREGAGNTGDDKFIRRKIMEIREKSMDHVIKKFMENYNTIVNGNFEGNLIDDLGDGSHIFLKELKKLVSAIYKKRDDSNEYRYQARQKIEAILSRLTEIVLKDETERNFEDAMIMEEMRQYTEKADKEINRNNNESRYYQYYLAIVDYLSGMTDSYITIFSDRLHSDYYEKKADDYKKDCLMELLNVSRFYQCDKVVEKISKVRTGNWSDKEKGIMLLLYLRNNQINGAARNNHQVKAFFRGIACAYNVDGGSFSNEEKERIESELLGED